MADKKLTLAILKNSKPFIDSAGFREMNVLLGKRVSIKKLPGKTKGIFEVSSSKGAFLITYGNNINKDFTVVG